VAAQVPRWPKLRYLRACGNLGPSDALGWVVVAALPSLYTVSTAATARRTLLSADHFNLSDSGLSEGVAAELRAAKAAVGSSARPTTKLSKEIAQA